MGKTVAHPGDLGPRQVRLVVQQLGGQPLHRLADLDEPNPDGIEDQTVGDVPTYKMSTDRIDRGKDVLESLPITAAHRFRASESTSASSPSLRSDAGTRSTGAPSRNSSSA